MGPDQSANPHLQLADLIANAFGERMLLPRELEGVPLLARYVAAVTPAVAPLRADHTVPSLGEELAHLLGSLESYLRDCAPGTVGARPWAQLILDGGAYEAFEQLRREAEIAVREIQPERELYYKWAPRPVKVREVLWHVAQHTAHHRGRLAVLMRLCGVEPPKS
jgi:uncharacterized damage-inducible protein DinB